MEWYLLSLIVFCVLCAIAAGIMLHQERKCPSCKKQLALRRTGKIENRGWFRGYYEEWKCDYCGHEIWRREPLWTM